MLMNHLFTPDPEAMSHNYRSGVGEPDEAEVVGIDLLRSTGRFVGSDRLLQHTRRLENYRIGLIPLDSVSQSDVASVAPGNLKSVVVLPLTWKELVVRVRTSVEQGKSRQSEESVSFGAVTINFSYMEATRSGEPVILTALDFKIIRYFAENARRAISRDELLNNVWGYNNYPSTRTVDNVVLRLRQALEPDPSEPIYFLTVRRVGYKFNPSGSGSHDSPG